MRDVRGRAASIVVMPSIKLMTLADYAQDHDFHAYCRHCGHSMPFMDIPALIEAVGGGTRIRDVGDEVECTTCRRRGCNVKMSYRGQMGLGRG